MTTWNDYRIEEEIAREWAAHGETYQYLWVRTLCRKIAHDLEMPRGVHTTLSALVREVMDAEGRTPALESARAWLKEAVK